MAEEEWSDQDLIEYEDWIHSESISEPILNKAHNNKTSKSEFLNEIEAIESRIKQFELSNLERAVNYIDVIAVKQEQESFDYNFKQVVHTLKANILPKEIIMDIVASYLLHGQYWNTSDSEEYANPGAEHTFVKQLLFNTNNLFADYWYTNPYETAAFNYLTIYEKKYFAEFKCRPDYCTRHTDPVRKESEDSLIKAKTKWIHEKGRKYDYKIEKITSCLINLYLHIIQLGRNCK